VTRALSKPGKSSAKPSSAKSGSKLARTLRVVPWATLLQGTVIVGRRWAALSVKERARLSELVRKSRGRMGTLSARERLELRKLAHKLDVRGMGDELMALRLRRRRRSARRKHG
jgi:hypothetical protein